MTEPFVWSGGQPENLLLDQALNVKIADFGLSNMMKVPWLPFITVLPCMIEATFSPFAFHQSVLQVVESVGFRLSEGGERV